MNEEVKCCLQDVDDVAEVVIGNEAIVSGPTSYQEIDELVCIKSGNRPYATPRKNTSALTCRYPPPFKFRHG